MARELFGTDGIRGRALEWPLDEPTLKRLGNALVQMAAGDPKPSFLIGGDTRASTETLANWLSVGIQAAGGSVTWGGVLPTPAVSYLLRQGSCTAGIVISASHNPAEDNGVKVLTADGKKISESMEELLEDELKRASASSGPGLPLIRPGLLDRYRARILESFEDTPQPLQGLHLVLDAANGAASGLADEVLETLGAKVTSIASDPDGRNINRSVGAASPAQLAEAVTRFGADGGFALDGDADRAILVDENGQILDGDDLLLAWGKSLHKEGRLPGNQVTATVMSNFGLESGLASEGIRLLRCAVGDRPVWESMARHGAALGGEQSGHIICSHLSVTGDGLLTGTHVLALAAKSGRPLSELSNLQRLPQVLINVRVGRRQPFEDLQEIQSLLKSIESTIEGRGRVLLRYSGTEPLVRVMLEGEDDQEIQGFAQDLADAIARALPA